MQIMISNELQEQMIEHAKKELPNECCGYITEGVQNILSHGKC